MKEFVAIEDDEMRAWRQILYFIKQDVAALNRYFWEKAGTLAELKDDLPTCPGVYKISDGVNTYIGRAIKKGGLKTRLKEHISKPHKEWGTNEERGRFVVEIHSMENDEEGRLWAIIVESTLISSERPNLNKKGKRGKLQLPENF